MLLTIADKKLEIVPPLLQIDFNNNVIHVLPEFVQMHLTRFSKQERNSLFIDREGRSFLVDKVRKRQVAPWDFHSEHPKLFWEMRFDTYEIHLLSLADVKLLLMHVIMKATPQFHTQAECLEAIKNCRNFERLADVCIWMYRPDEEKAPGKKKNAGRNHKADGLFIGETVQTQTGV